MLYKLLQTAWRYVEILWFCLVSNSSYLMQESFALDLTNDCSRFVTQYFGIISISAPHIYHSALVLTPRKSIVQELYK